MIPYALRTLRSQPMRLALTIGGVALCLVLILFLLAVYRGVADGSVDYVRHNRADLWVLQKNASNILRGTSFVFLSQRERILRIDGVASATPVLLLLATVQKEGSERTVFLTGYDPGQRLGGPPRLAAGRPVRSEDEIVLDRCFAKKFGFRVGDVVRIQDRALRVVGLSAGTNAFVIQYAFVPFGMTQKLAGVPGMATCFLVKAKDPRTAESLAGRIRREIPGVEVYTHERFLNNNIHEMRSGFLPLLYTVAVIGAVVLTVILSLLLSVNILERRKDFAVLKALGSPPGFLRRLVLAQALLIAAGACGAALALFPPLVLLVQEASPEVSTKSSWLQALAVVGMALVTSVLSSLLAVRKLRRIYALEAFR